MKLICDFSFVNDYAENFFSDEDRGSATIINSSIVPHLRGKPILAISFQTMDELYKIHSGRELMLDTVFDLCEKFDIALNDRMENLIKMAAICEIEDEETYVLAEDDYIINEINKTTHKAISIEKALEILRDKSMLSDIPSTPLEEGTTPSEE